ncbi:hypothetical protein BTRA_3403 [Burkholderia thailandensis USAMRU Malaysia |uniref:Panacea domain-containing protein n=1 Tax=Burkholderia thailandensis TaxID=57975 RepID=UPI0003ECAAC0|nr:type II toxin-antitoxin system antitoxin SocA domain-containing protein [Burkholderia thailandensis]AHI77686.1 hypothetical protein BTJ_1824 [Burkholderia thailandensis E444]AIC85741.1 hypothetical protein BTRA_3403 [Burkholderia thailandensis USAMRU Malaysia \
MAQPSRKSKPEIKATALAVARYIIRRFQDREDPVTNLKLQKLLYYVQGWHLGVFGTPAFEDDFEAWVHGPVAPGVFHAYRDYRWNPITKEVDEPKLPESLKKHIDEVLDVYGGDTGWALESRTHREPPWLKARGDLPADESSNAVISKKSMKKFFEAQAADE